jgi:hypothetical protein
MATLTRRNTNHGEPKQRSNSLWEQEADNYWQEMEPAKKYKTVSRCVGLLLLGLLAVGGVAWSTRSVWNHVDLTNLAILKERFFPMAPANITPATHAADPPKATTTPASTIPPSQPPTNAKLSANDPAVIDLLRARCRVRGVQTRWHEETCRKLCIRSVANMFQSSGGICYNVKLCFCSGTGIRRTMRA